MRAQGLDGDERAEQSVHGGADNAVYAFAAEDSRWWSDELGRELGPAAFGQNLLTEGLDVTGARIGERWRVGSALLEVTQPRFPCAKLGMAFGDPGMLRRFGRADRPGAYLRVLEEGEAAAGDAVEVVERPEESPTLARVNEAVLRDHSLLGEVLAAPRLAARLREWAEPRAPGRLDTGPRRG